MPNNGNGPPFYQLEETILGKPLILPDITKYTQKEETIEEKSIILNTIDLEAIHVLQKEAHVLSTPQTEKMHPVGWSVLSTLTTITIFILVSYGAWKIRQKIKNPTINENNPKKPENKQSSLLFSS